MTTTSTELAVKTENPAELMRRATDVAGVCKEIVKRTARQIGNRQYVQVEGWLSIATAHGCVASADQVEQVDGGIRAVGSVRRMDTGAVIATGEGFVGDDEPTWSKRPLYARRAMAQTRAISRACRSAFAHVVVMIDSNLSTTPAEEVPENGFEPSTPAPVPTPKLTVVPKKKAADPVEVEEVINEVVAPPIKEWMSAVVPIGKNKGKKLEDLKPFSIMWFYKNYEANPKYSDSVAFRASVEEWFKDVGINHLAAYNRMQDEKGETPIPAPAPEPVAVASNDLADDDIPF